MSLNQAFAALLKMPTPVLRTNDAAALWAVSCSTASTMLGRLAKVDLIRRLTRGLWLLQASAHPWSLHPYLTDPSPSYLTLHTALFHHGMIEQIPTVIHVASTAKSRTVVTDIGEFVIHQVAPKFFTGFEPLAGGPAQMATPEKALVDFLYLRPTKDRAFRALPELELPQTFRQKRAYELAGLIVSSSRRLMVQRLLAEVCKKREPPPRR